MTTYGLLLKVYPDEPMYFVYEDTAFRQVIRYARQYSFTDWMIIRRTGQTQTTMASKRQETI